MSKQQPSKVMFSLLALSILAVLLFGMNLYHEYRCSHAKEHRDFSNNVLDMRRRLRHIESKNMLNALVIHNTLKLLQIRLRDKELEEVDILSNKGEDEALKVALALAGAPDIYPTEFDMDPKFQNAEILYDMIDKVIGDTTVSLESSGLGSSTLEYVPDSEQLDKCKHWQQIYRVVIGRSWGDLPLSLQKSWKNFNCDYKFDGSINNQDNPSSNIEEMDRFE